MSKGRINTPANPNTQLEKQVNLTKSAAWLCVEPIVDRTGISGHCFPLISRYRHGTLCVRKERKRGRSCTLDTPGTWRRNASDRADLGCSSFCVMQPHRGYRDNQVVCNLCPSKKNKAWISEPVHCRGHMSVDRFRNPSLVFFTWTEVQTYSFFPKKDFPFAYLDKGKTHTNFGVCVIL
jgi:hypothetical protein